MEFGEKLQNLRKTRGITQEELAESLFVSRTAVSKWESGRGYPNINALQDISKFFSVTIDELLSGENLLCIAKNENKANIIKMCDLMFAIIDLFWLLAIVLPLYPNKIGDFVYSVNLFDYQQNFQIIYLVLFDFMIVFGIFELMTLKVKTKIPKVIIMISLTLNVLAITFLALTRVVYAVVISLLFLIIKCAVVFKKVKVGL